MRACCVVGMVALLAGQGAGLCMASAEYNFDQLRSDLDNPENSDEWNRLLGDLEGKAGDCSVMDDFIIDTFGDEPDLCSIVFACSNVWRG
jgi:hypothetical protein